MNEVAFVAGLTLLLGCSGSVEKDTSAGGGGMGTGGDTASAGGSPSGGTGGQGGTGGLFDPGTGGTGGAVVPEGCSIVLDEGFHVSFTVDGQSTELASHCIGDDGYGPYAAWVHPKGGSPSFVIEACAAPDNGLPFLGLGIQLTEKGEPYASIQYSDAAGVPSEGTTDTMDVPTFGEPWDNVSGTFSAKTTTPDGGAHVIDGKFLVCRRPDLYAP